MPEACPFVWYELATTDPAGAAAFYAQVIGWQAAPAPGAPADKPYELFALPGQMPAAGMLALPEAARARGVEPHWLGYVGVPELDAWLARARSLGAQVVLPATEVPGMLRFAVIRDPQGAPIGLLQPLDPPPDARPDYAAMGRPAWHEHYAEDLDAALAFYAALFGWRVGESLEMGAMGRYQFYQAGETVLGGMMRRPPHIARPRWNYYVNVPGIEAAVGACLGAGGAVLHGPVEVPGGQWVVNARDLQGAEFALVGPK